MSFVRQQVSERLIKRLLNKLRHRSMLAQLRKTFLVEEYSNKAEHDAKLDRWNSWQAEQDKVRSELLSQRPNSLASVCLVCGHPRDLAINYDGDSVNLRETFRCPTCHFNNRQRAFLTLFRPTLDGSKGQIYITEQTTGLFQWLSSRYGRVLGSEYLGPEVVSGTVNENGIRHEDMTRLSLKDGSVDLFLSFECHEHIPDYRAAFREMYRVLASNGKAIMSFPYCGRGPTVVRAVVREDGSIEHLWEPEYHGDPIRQEGILAFYNFGINVLDDLRDAGFKRVKVVKYFSPELGHPQDVGQEFIVVEK